MEGLVKQLIQLAMFSAFIHAIVEVIKGISAKGIVGIFRELFRTLIKNGGMSEGTIKTLIFCLALLYCRAFDFGAMITMLGVTVEDTNALAWWLDYVGTSSVVFVGVDVFYGWFKKLRTVIETPASE